MKTIGQFAKQHNVTVKTLHHYEKMDLVLPEHVDQDSGYRYYGVEATNNLKLVLFMKELGFSLSEIKNIVKHKDNTELLQELLKLKRKQTKSDQETTERRLFQINKLLSISRENINITCEELIQMSEETLYTGKYGRGTFIEESLKRFEMAKQNKTPLSIIQMDLDHFHNVNKNFGYDAGDIVLDRTQSEIISVLQESKYETLLERKGGDEFSVVVNASAMNASLLATKILNRVIAIDYSDISEDLKVSITAGIAGMTKNINSYSELAQEAIIKLYQAKRNR